MWLYKIVNRNSGKSYIGKTTQSRPIRRWQAHVSAAKKGSTACRGLHGALRKYGAENFEFIPFLYVDSESELATLERVAIAHFDTLSPKGYNLSPDGNVAGVEGRKRLSQSLRGNTNASGKRDAAFSQRMSDANRDCKSYLFISPEGQEYEVTNLSAFCKSNGIHASNIANRGVSKGWKLTRLY